MFEEILSSIAKALDQRGIPYMVIGGQAVLLYGEPRLTRDIDITLGVAPDRLDEILSAVRELSLVSLPDKAETFVSETMVLPTLHESTGIRVDFVFSLTPYEADAISRARRVVLKGGEVAFISPEDLIIHKIFSGRPRDLDDAKSVLLKNPDMDRGYIRKRLREFEEALERDDFLRTFEQLLPQA